MAKTKHTITALDGTAGVKCLCGWQRTLDYPLSYGSRAAIDALLDFFNAHKAAVEQRKAA